MKHRIGKEYNKVKCPLCNSVYLLEDQDMHWTKFQIDPQPVIGDAGETLLDENDDPIMDDGIRWRFSFFCDECYQNVWGRAMGKIVLSDEIVEEYESQMRPLYEDIKTNNRRNKL